MAGSMNGLGVLESKYIGKLMATFEPRLSRILAVRVLRKINVRKKDGDLKR